MCGSGKRGWLGKGKMSVVSRARMWGGEGRVGANQRGREKYSIVSMRDEEERREEASSDETEVPCRSRLAGGSC